MIRGLPASIIVHASVFAMAYIGLPYFGFGVRTYEATVEVVDVDFVEIGAITNIAPSRIQPEPVEPEPIEEVVPDEPVDEAEIEELPEAEQDATQPDEAPALPEDSADTLPDFEAETETVEPEPEDLSEPEPEPVASKRERPVDPLANFLDSSESTFKSEIETRKARPDPTPASAEPKPQTELKDAPAPAQAQPRRAAGERNGNVARLESLIQSRIRDECWAGVDDLPNPERLNVQMRVLLNQNGTIADLRLVSPGRRPLGRSPMGTAVDRALRAVNKCAPYRLPSEDYADWQEVNVFLGLGFADKK